MAIQMEIDRLDVVTVTALVAYRQRLQEQVAEANAALQVQIDRMATKYGVDDGGAGYELWQAPDGTVYVRARAAEKQE